MHSLTPRLDRRYSIYEASVEHWKVVLKLAQLWEFKEVKELAVRELHKKEELSIFERLALYQEHKVDPHHLIPLYSILCERDTPLNVEESTILGIETTVLIARMREQLRSPPTSPVGRNPLPPSLDTAGVFRAFESEFKLGEGSTAQFHVENGYLSPTSGRSIQNTMMTTTSFSLRWFHQFLQQLLRVVEVDRPLSFEVRTRGRIIKTVCECSETATKVL